MTPPTYLYPRLPLERAGELYERCRTHSLTELAELSALSDPEAAPHATGGMPVEPGLLAKVRDEVRAVARATGFPDPLKNTGGFDRACGRVLYESMGIVPADAADEGVWSFLSLVVLPEIGPWRFPTLAPERILGRPRNVLRRLWWRAWTFGADLEFAPPGCTPMGEDEFVGIMERPTLGGNQRLARAIRDAMWRQEANGLPVARSEFMRQMSRRVRAERSHIAIDALADAQLELLLDELAEASLRALEELPRAI